MDDRFTTLKMGTNYLCEIIQHNLSEKNETGANILNKLLTNFVNIEEDYCSTNISILGTYIIGIFHLILQSIYYVSQSVGLSIPGLITVIIIIYLFYQNGIKPYNYIQDLDLPGQTEKRKDIVNLMRKLRKIGKKLPPAYANGWYLLAESSDVKPGEVKQVNCIGENFAVFRTLDGEIHVSNAYCPHLGANLAVGGLATDNCIECPFHKWRFDASSGKCVSIPNVENVPKGVDIKIWKSVEVNGGIHIWYDIEGQPPHWEVPSVERIDNGDWVYHGRNEFLIASHMQDIPENGADIAHLNAIHADHLIAGKTLPTPITWNFLGIHEWGGLWENGSLPHEAIVTLNHKIVFIEKYLSIQFKVTARQVGPSYVLLVLQHRLGDVVFLQSVTPLEPLLQKVIHRLYAPWYLRPIANMMMWGETVMFHRDVMIWNSKEFVYSPILSKSDKCIKSFRKWFQQFYSDNSIPFKDAFLGPQKDILDW